jgi:hypothetical protein
MPPHIPRGDLFSLDITKGTQPYIESMAKQANGSFEQGWYDACAVMVRRLLETLIIECYEYHEIADSIKGSDGNFLYLGGLISRFLGENKWNINRNARAALSNLPKLKGIGDLSAHNRGFNAGLKDIRDIQTELRIVIEEMVRIACFGRTTSAST